MRPRHAGLRSVVDFWLFEQLNALSWSMNLGVFRLLCIGAMATLLPVVTAGALFGTRLLHTVAPLPGALPGLAFLLVHLYVGGAYVVREVFSRRRHSVSGSPNEGFYRALDLRALDVFFVYCAIRIMRFYLVLLLVDAAFLYVFRESLGGAWSVGLVMPVGLCALTLGVSARLATDAGAWEPSGAKALVPVGLILFVTGMVTGHLLGQGDAASHRSEHAKETAAGFATGLAPDMSAGHPFVLSAGLAGAAALAAGTVLVWRAGARLRRESFVIRPAPPSRAGRRSMAWLALLPLLAVVHRQFVSGRTYGPVWRIYVVVTMTLLLLIGVRLPPAGPLPLSFLSQPMERSIIAVTFIVLLGGVELLLAICGPTALSPQFRFAWENLLSPRQIAVSAALYYAAHALALASGIAAIGWAATRQVLWHVPFLGLAVLSASLIAESLTTAPKRLVDGTSAPGVFVACLSVALSLPALIGCLAQPVPSRLLAVVYSVALFTGAITCIGRRVQTLPLTSPA